MMQSVVALAASQEAKQLAEAGEKIETPDPRQAVAAADRGVAAGSDPQVAPDAGHRLLGVGDEGSCRSAARKGRCSGERPPGGSRPKAAAGGPSPR